MNITLPENAWKGTRPTVEALLDRWLVQEGDAVRRGQPLASVVLETTSLDIEAPADGSVSHILVWAGQTFHRCQPLATMEPEP